PASDQGQTFQVGYDPRYTDARGRVRDRPRPGLIGYRHPVGDKPKVLVVGAGAVGQVYGRHAALGGAEVTFFVREKYRSEVEKGFDMYPLNRRNRTEVVRFESFTVVSRADEVAATKFDQVYLTVSSSALAGPWLAELVAAAGDATILALQPGQDDLDTIVAAGAARDRVVSGVITLISYHAPLPGETRFPKPGMAYWFPPLSPSLVSGPAERTAAVIAVLRAGRLPVKRHPDVPRFAAFPTAMMMPYLIGLESAGWTFRGLATGPIQLAAQGAREAMAIVARTSGKPPLMMRVVARPRVLRMGLWFARRVVPLPLEIYLREHFIKVGDQTRMFMAGYIARGRAAGMPVTALEQLSASVATAAAA
ncbi:MAG: 2-dehydropantoate 2-reductase N-terminal domain-containing protein, partial [Polyangiales bacterium]